jgi:hypothetical protein
VLNGLLSRAVATGASLLLLTLGSPDLSQVSDQPETTALQPQYVVFDGATTLLDRTGRPVPLRIKVARWALGNSRRVEEFPKQGFLILDSLAGAMAVTIDGQSPRIVDGATIVVPSRSRLRIETTADTVVFQTIEIAREQPK